VNSTLAEDLLESEFCLRFSRMTRIKTKDIPRRMYADDTDLKKRRMFFSSDPCHPRSSVTKKIMSAPTAKIRAKD
jgi:hypothetical protein